MRPAIEMLRRPALLFAVALASCDALTLGGAPARRANVAAAARVPAAQMGLMEWLADLLYDTQMRAAKRR